MIAHSTSKRNLKVQKLGPSSEQQALMVRIDWTTSQVVKITSREDFRLATVTMWVRKDGYQVVSTQDVPVHKDTTLYFIASNEQGWYYLLKWSESFQQYGCTCISGRIRHTCRHQHILADHLERSVVVSAPAAEVPEATRELRNVYGRGEYKPQYRDASGVWYPFKDEQGNEVYFLGGCVDWARKFIEVDSDAHRTAVIAEMIAEYVAAEHLQEVA